MVQYFMEEHPALRFHSETTPRLCYMGKITPEISSYPRILHSHGNHVEISVIYSGESQYLIQNRMRLIRRGDILIYNSGAVHDELSSVQAPIGSYFFAIGNLQVPGLRENALIPDEVSPVFHVSQDFPRILQLCEAILDSLEVQSVWSAHITYFSVLALLEIIWHIIHGNPVQREACPENFAGLQIKNYIDQHFREPLTLKTIAADLRLSESYVSHMFKEMLGYTPMQYVLRRKIGEAQTLLISTDLPITEIAQTVGYDSQSHFNQRFKQYVGISPGTFRRNYKEGHAPPGVRPASPPEKQES